MGQHEEFKGIVEVPTLGYRAVKDKGQVIAVTQQAQVRIAVGDEDAFDLCERLRDMIGMSVRVTIELDQVDMFVGFTDAVQRGRVSVHEGGGEEPDAS